MSVQERQPVVSVGEWFFAQLLLAIPLVNLIIILLWAFGGGVNQNKVNLAKAMLLVWLIIFGFVILLLIMGVGILQRFARFF